jgi:hypothetical protein
MPGPLRVRVCFHRCFPFVVVVVVVVVVSSVLASPADRSRGFDLASLYAHLLAMQADFLEFFAQDFLNFVLAFAIK